MWRRSGTIAILLVMFSVGTLQAQFLPEDGLVSWWDFDEASGTIAHDWLGGNDATLHGCSWATGVSGGALALNGVSDFVEVRHDPSLNMTDEMAIMGWIYLRYPTDCVILCKQPTNPKRSNYPGNYEFTLRVTGALRFGYETAVGNFDYVFYESTVTVSTGVWHHVAVTLKKKGSVVFYLDSQEVGTFAQRGEFGMVNREPARIGTRKDLPNFFPGYMDDLSLFRRALTAQDIARAWSPIGDGICYVDGSTGNDANDGRNHEQAFATIQKGIDAAKSGETVLVYPGVYKEAISFKGKAITVRSAADAATIECPGSAGVSFTSGEGSLSILKNLIIRDCSTGVSIKGGSPTLQNLTIVSCGTGIKATGGLPQVRNCILWGNTQADVVGCWIWYSCTERYYAATGNISADPLFVDPVGGDYHLCSTGGMYSPLSGTWVTGAATSPCLDAGDPGDDWSMESAPNGGRIDMGAHGGTPYASRSTK